jgi:hypothetical protein
MLKARVETAVKIFWNKSERVWTVMAAAQRKQRYLHEAGP